MSEKGIGRKERLKSVSEIENLFKKGSSVYAYPFRLFFIESSTNVSSQFLVSVPKRNFKRAVDRNLLKRRTRESYRLQKVILERNWKLGFVYTSKKIERYATIEKGIQTLLKKIENQ